MKSFSGTPCEVLLFLEQNREIIKYRFKNENQKIESNFIFYDVLVFFYD